MLARRDTRREAARLRRLSPLQTLENQSQIWGICCHSCTGREGLPPSWKLSYKTYVLRFTRESRFSFNQRIARVLMCYPKLTQDAHRLQEACRCAMTRENVLRNAFSDGTLPRAQGRYRGTIVSPPLGISAYPH